MADGFFIFVLIIIFGVVMWSITDGVIRKPTPKMTMSREHFQKVKKAIEAGKSDEEIMETLYVDKYDIHIVKSILAKHAKEKLNGN